MNLFIARNDPTELDQQNDEPWEKPVTSIPLKRDYASWYILRVSGWK